MTAVDCLCVFQQSAVDEVASIFINDVKQAKAELKFWYELKERQIDVAPHADLQIEVERLEPQRIMLAGGKVHHRIYAGNEVGTEVIVSRGSKLQVDGHRDISALEDLRAVGSAPLLMIDTMLLPEVDCGREAKRKVFVQAEVAKDTYREARAVAVNLCIPLLASLWVDVAVVLQLHILHVQAKQEAIMKLPLVDIRAVLHLSLLCREAQGKDKYEERDETPQSVSTHHNNNVSTKGFIAQIIVFGD